MVANSGLFPAIWAWGGWDINSPIFAWHIGKEAAKAALELLQLHALLQPFLPQVLIGNNHRLTAKLLKEVKANLPPPVHVWRRHSAWNTAKDMRKFVSFLLTLLDEKLESRTIMLIVDVSLDIPGRSKIWALIERLVAAPSHIKALALTQGTWNQIVLHPKMTKWLQRREVYVFQKVKGNLKEAKDEKQSKQIMQPHVCLRKIQQTPGLSMV